MMLSLIWAQDERGLIGADGRLPWRLPADMAWFRRHTLGKPVLMGRKTFESIGRPLPDRINIVLTRSRRAIESCRVARSLDEALSVARLLAGDSGELMVMGGAQIYRLALPRAGRLYMTLVHGIFEGDAFFPPWEPAGWRETLREEHAADERNPHACTFRILERADERLGERMGDRAGRGASIA